MEYGFRCMYVIMTFPVHVRQDIFSVHCLFFLFGPSGIALATPKLYIFPGEKIAPVKETPLVSCTTYLFNTELFIENRIERLFGRISF